jgi:hypothetical protein
MSLSRVFFASGTSGFFLLKKFKKNTFTSFKEMKNISG